MVKSKITEKNIFKPVRQQFNAYLDFLHVLQHNIAFGFCPQIQLEKTQAEIKVMIQDRHKKIKELKNAVKSNKVCRYSEVTRTIL